MQKKKGKTGKSQFGDDVSLYVSLKWCNIIFIVLLQSEDSSPENEVDKPKTRQKGKTARKKVGVEVGSVSIF